MKNVLRFSFHGKVAAYSLIGLTVLLVAFSDMPVSRGVLESPLANGAANADIKVSGTSNLHDWAMEDKDVACTAIFTFPTAKDIVPTGLETLRVSFPVHNLKSGKSGMDSKAYTALNAKDGGNIVFTSTTSTVVPGVNRQFRVKSNGHLTIAGVMKPMVMDAACQAAPDGTISCTGTEKMKMSDFRIKPPTYMLGALKTGDALTIDFKLIIKK